MSGRERARIYPKDRSCECLDRCLESAGLTLSGNVISILNRSFVDCYLKCSECCKGIDYVSRFSEKASKILMNVYRCESAKQILDCAIKKYVNSLIEGVKQIFPTVLMFKARLLSRLTIHCSSKHLPLQISLAWDPLFNVPYIPSSSIKGVVRSYFEENNISIDNVKVEELFGSAEHQGELVFFDAYPIECKGKYLVEADIITPHYRELDGLIDEARTSPTPLIFPVIARDVELGLIIALKKTLSKKLTQNTINMLIGYIAGALEKGLGAKTSVGYGRIKVVEYQESESIEKKEQQK